MKRTWLAIGMLCHLATGAGAQDAEFCAEIQGFVAAAGSKAASEKVVLSLPSVFDSAPECGASLFMSGARSLHCAWGFAYRDTAATATFEALTRRVADCPGATAPKKAAGLVNHPDSYDQRSLRFADGAVSISLKDKGSLQKTYIFVRTQAAP